MVLVDVRGPREFEANHVRGATNIPVAICGHGMLRLTIRSRLFLFAALGIAQAWGASLLRQRGFQDVYNVAGGMTGYSAAGFSKECAMCVAPHISGFTGKRMS